MTKEELTASKTNIKAYKQYLINMASKPIRDPDTYFKDIDNAVKGLKKAVYIFVSNINSSAKTKEELKKRIGNLKYDAVQAVGKLERNQKRTIKKRNKS